MEGRLLFYVGSFRGYKPVMALIEDGCNELLLFKKEIYEDQVLRIGLSSIRETSRDLVYSEGPL